ncbi:alkaline phosphatase [Lysinibacillus sp. RSDA_15]|uniref:alkaline phosphatase n=1 Tax=Lysinibacillus TaxID=400634 RepID=UPI0018CCF9F9|nr:alkaline phosphatase [Lysinibacillus sphaericus]MBG9754194.1 hypothetical protein [Lysinibacillus sphaericus]QTB15743.1 alkaline phosphatase [Lysinibacillus sphaericus]
MKNKKTIMILVDGMSFELMKLPQSIDLSLLSKTELSEFYPESMEYFDIWERFTYRSFLDPAANRQVKISSADVATMISVGMFPHLFTKLLSKDTKVPNLFSLLKNQGAKLAAVTNCPLTDSTIGMFLCPEEYHSYNEKTDLSFTNNTDMETNIALNLENSPWDLLAGGGRRAFYDKNTCDPVTKQSGIRTDGRNLLKEYKERSDYKVLFEDEYNENIKVDWAYKNLWLLHHGYFRFHVERSATNASEPSLSDLSLKVIESLDESNNPWFCLIESGRVDHAAHNNNSYYALGELLEVFRLVSRILKKPNSHEYNIILTSDHGTGGLAFLEENYVPYNALEGGVQWANGPGKNRLDTAVYHSGEGARGLRAIKNFTPNIEEAPAFRFQPSGDYQKVGSHNRTFVPFIVNGPDYNHLSGCMFPHELFYAIKSIYTLKESVTTNPKVIILLGVNNKVTTKLEKSFQWHLIDESSYFIDKQVSNQNTSDISTVNIVHDIESVLKRGMSVLVSIASLTNSDFIRYTRLTKYCKYRIIYPKLNKENELIIHELHNFSKEINTKDFDCIADDELIFNSIAEYLK